MFFSLHLKYLCIYFVSICLFIDTWQSWCWLLSVSPFFPRSQFHRKKNKKKHTHISSIIQSTRSHREHRDPNAEPWQIHESLYKVLIHSNTSQRKKPKQIHALANGRQFFALDALILVDIFPSSKYSTLSIVSMSQNFVAILFNSNQTVGSMRRPRNPKMKVSSPTESQISTFESMLI